MYFRYNAIGCLLMLSCGLSVLSAAPVSFLTSEVEYRLGESVMIPVELKDEASVDTVLEIVPQKKGVVEVIRQPEILQDQKMGFARIRTIARGEVMLECGEASLRVRVLDERPVALMRKLTPRFTSPSSNSSVWGTIHVGAEMWVGAPGVDRAQVPDAKLMLPDGRELAAVETFPPIDGPFWRMVYEVDTSKLPAGECKLMMSCKAPLASAKGNAELLVSEEHKIQILPPPAEEDFVMLGECEDFLSTPRSERMGNEAPLVVMDAAAGGHRAVTLRAGKHSWVLKPEIPEDGNYQIMVRARGTMFGSAYASLGVILGENITDAGSVRLSTSSWHRVPVGRPISLKKGEQWIGIALANEFRYRNQSLRHADIDQFEIRKVVSVVGGGGMMMGGMMMQAGDSKKGEGEKVQEATRLRCAFSTIREGLKTNGRMEMRASLHSPSLKNDKDYEGIRSDLWINDSYFATAWGRHASFAVYPHDLKKGENRMFVQSVSPCGNSAISLTQTVLSGEDVKRPEIGYDSDRWDLNRKGWEETKRVELKKDHRLAKEGAPAAIHLISEGSAKVRLNLPNELAGKRRISLLAHLGGEVEKGRLVIKVHQPKAPQAHFREVTIGKPDATDSWAWQGLSEVEFFQGQKFISITSAEGEVAFGGISIDTPKFMDAAAPELEVLYPKPNAKISAGGDAVVVKAFDDLRLSHFDVFVDGQKAPLSYPASRDAGPMILHLPATVLKTGARKIEVVAIDSWGKETGGAAIPVEVREVSEKVLDIPYPRAVRLANRFAYGQDASTMIAILTKGEEAWLKEECDSSWGSKHDLLCEAYANVLFTDVSDYNLRGRVITHLLTSRNPVRHRFTLFAQNHFSTWMAKTGVGAKWRENQEFRDVGISRFNDLLLTSATSPAMMVYLDQQNSLALQLNENYAREVMELHTVGVHGGYEQSDVTNLAHVLTGWGAQREATMDGMAMDFNYRFAPYLNENKEFEIFGLRVPASTSPESADDRIAQVIEMLSCRPQTARFISEKVVMHYMGSPPHPDVVDQLANEYLRTNGDLRAMLLEMVRSPCFMAKDAAPKVMTPVDYGVSMQRISSSMHPWSIISLADRSGRNLFDRASPDGYPEKNEEYADSNYQLQKWSYCKELDQSFANGFPQSWFEKDKLKDAAHRDYVIDHAFAARRGEVPTEGTREALRSILSEEMPDSYQHRSLFSSFLHMMPEFQIR